MSQFCLPNCSAEYKAVVPDPDIDGIGVLVAFLVPSCLTLLASVFARIICIWSLGISMERRDYIFTVLERFVLGQSDQQLLTSIAILTAGYIKCDITVTHFSIVRDLAWISAGTHMTAAPVIAGYMKKHRAARLWRMFLMFCICFLLMTATLLTANEHWGHRLRHPARCLFKDTFASIRKPGIIAQLVVTHAVLAYAYASMMIAFSEKLSSHQDVWLHKARDALPSPVQLFRKLTTTVKQPFRTAITLFSLPIEFAWLIIWIKLLFLHRADIDQYNHTSPTDIQTWGFGQLVPLFLIGLPFLTALEISCEEYKKFTRRKSDIAASQVSLAVVPSASNRDTSSDSVQASEATGQEAESRTIIGMLPKKQNYESDSSQAAEEALVSPVQQAASTFMPPSRQDTEMRVGMDPGHLARTGTGRFRNVLADRAWSLRMGESSGIDSPHSSLASRRGSLAIQNSPIDRQITPSIGGGGAPANSAKQQLKSDDLCGEQLSNSIKSPFRIINSLAPNLYLGLVLVLSWYTALSLPALSILSLSLSTPPIDAFVTITGLSISIFFVLRTHLRTPEVL